LKELDETAIPATYYYGFNTSKAPFDEPLVRRAFSYAIDRQAIVDEIGGQRQPATTFVHPETLGRNLYGEVGCSYDPNKARELLAQAGYPNGKGLPEIVLMYNLWTGDSHRKIAEAVQKMWLAVLGVNIRLESMEWEAYLDLLAVDAPQVYRLGWSADYNDPIDFLNVFHSANPNNYGNLVNHDYDKLVEAAAVEGDKAKRLEMFIEAERILCETEAAIAPIYHYTVER
jgi:oligopeptide transport system substrate-binding protein